MKTSKTGIILWWSVRDGNGIVNDHKGDEHYIDNSTVDFNPGDYARDGAGMAVTFEPWILEPDNLLCGRKVRPYKHELKDSIDLDATLDMLDEQYRGKWE